MDRARIELLTPLLTAEMHQEARRAALADLVRHTSRPNLGNELVLWLGSLLIRFGCRLDALGRRHRATMALGLLPSPCGRAE